MLTITKIKGAQMANPNVPQWRVYDPARSASLSMRILKSNPRSFSLYADRWSGERWEVVERVAVLTSQEVAYCEAGTWLGLASVVDRPEEEAPPPAVAA